MSTPYTPEWAITRKIKLSSRYSVEMTVGPGGFTCEWSPDIPKPKSLNQTEMARYRAGRDALIAGSARRARACRCCSVIAREHGNRRDAPGLISAQARL